MTLIGHWVLDEDSGSTAYDYSGNENHGSITGAGPAGTGTVTGPFGNSAYSFDGSNDRVTVSNNSYLEPSNFTIHAKFIINNQPSGSGLSDYSILAKGTNDGNIDRNGYFLAYRDDSNGNKSIESGYVNSSSNFEQLSIARSLNTGQWYDISFTFDGATQRVYLNGILIGSRSVGDSTIDYSGSVEQLKIGVAENSNGFEYVLDGSLSDIRLYSRALTPHEIQYLYQAGVNSEAVYK